MTVIRWPAELERAEREAWSDDEDTYTYRAILLDELAWREARPSKVWFIWMTLATIAALAAFLAAGYGLWRLADVLIEVVLQWL